MTRDKVLAVVGAFITFLAIVAVAAAVVYPLWAGVRNQTIDARGALPSGNGPHATPVAQAVPLRETELSPGLTSRRLLWTKRGRLVA